jgi:hypothetical protein
VQRGWEFRFQDRVFYVGAADVEAARYLVLQHLRSEGDVRPKKIPESVLQFLGVRDGTLIEARIFDFSKAPDAN